MLSLKLSGSDRRAQQMRALICRLRVTAIALILAAASYTPSYPGDVLQDTWEVVSDPIGLSRSSKELSDSVQRTIIQLNQFEGVANSHVKERLEQIRSILHDAIGGTDEAIKKAMAAMRDIERQVNID